VIGATVAERGWAVLVGREDLGPLHDASSSAIAMPLPASALDLGSLFIGCAPFLLRDAARIPHCG
jgi:hypothetical protein